MMAGLHGLSGLVEVLKDLADSHRRIAAALERQAETDRLRLELEQQRRREEPLD